VWMNNDGNASLESKILKLTEDEMNMYSEEELIRLREDINRRDIQLENIRDHCIKSMKDLHQQQKRFKAGSKEYCIIFGKIRGISEVLVFIDHCALDYEQKMKMGLIYEERVALEARGDKDE